MSLATIENGKVVLRFNGFESLHGFDEDIMYALEDYEDRLFPEIEWQGTLKVTLEYEDAE